MKDKKVRAVCEWVDGVCEVAFACETRISLRGDARELPPEAPTQDEAHAFRDGFVIGMQVASGVLEAALDTGRVADMDGLEAYGRANHMWMRMREERSEGGE